MTKFIETEFHSWPVWGYKEEQELIYTLNSGIWAGNRAKRLKDFASKFAIYQDTLHGVCLANGTVTLEAALVACGIGEGDEVIVPSTTFISTASAVLRVNSIPIIVDIDPNTFCIDCTKIEKAVTSNTKAIIAVHLAGVMADMDFLINFCKEKKLFLIEDCAHAHGSSWNNKKAGSFGDFGSFSFQHSKLMSSGEGGCLISNDKNMLDKAWNYSNCGREIGKEVYYHSTVGSNYRMTEWQASVLYAQLDRYPTQLTKREKNAKKINNEILKINGLFTQEKNYKNTNCGYYSYIFRFNTNMFKLDAQKKFFDILSNANVPLCAPYPPINDLKLFTNNSISKSIRKRMYQMQFDTTEARNLYSSSIWLHHRVLISEDNVIDRLIELIKDTARKLYI